MENIKEYNSFSTANIPRDMAPAEHAGILVPLFTLKKRHQAYFL
jgi:hypothetical protein